MHLKSDEMPLQCGCVLQAAGKSQAENRDATFAGRAVRAEQRRAVAVLVVGDVVFRPIRHSRARLLVTYSVRRLDMADDWTRWHQQAVRRLQL
jgi:hypothetical protein